MSKRSKFANAILYKCPQCQEGDFYVKPFSIKDPLNMHKYCPVCGLDNEPEPGYYFGAMFLSYIMTGFFYLSVAGLCMIVLKIDLYTTMLILVGVLILTYLFFLRFSRALWINLMIKYNPDNKRSRE